MNIYWLHDFKNTCILTHGQQIKHGLYEFKFIFTYLRNKWLKKSDQTSKEHSSLTFMVIYSKVRL